MLMSAGMCVAVRNKCGCDEMYSAELAGLRVAALDGRMIMIWAFGTRCVSTVDDGAIVRVGESEVS